MGFPKLWTLLLMHMSVTCAIWAQQHLQCSCHAMQVACECWLCPASLCTLYLTKDHLGAASCLSGKTGLHHQHLQQPADFGQSACQNLQAGLRSCASPAPNKCTAHKSSALQVWEEAAQAQVLRIAAFTPHTDTKLSTTNAQSEAKRHHMEQDIASLALHLATLRSWVYFGITIRLQPLVEDFATKHGQGFWDLDAAADDARSVLPLPARMPELLSVRRCAAQSC